jgi:hypothetical protein
LRTNRSGSNPGAKLQDTQDIFQRGTTKPLVFPSVEYPKEAQ